MTDLMPAGYLESYEYHDFRESDLDEMGELSGRGISFSGVSGGVNAQALTLTDLRIPNEVLSNSTKRYPWLKMVLKDEFDAVLHAFTARDLPPNVFEELFRGMKVGLREILKKVEAGQENVPVGKRRHRAKSKREDRHKRTQKAAKKARPRGPDAGPERTSEAFEVVASVTDLNTGNDLTVVGTSAQRASASAIARMDQPESHHNYPIRSLQQACVDYSYGSRHGQGMLSL